MSTDQTEALADAVFIAVKSYIDRREVETQRQAAALEARVQVLERMLILSLQNRVPTGEARAFDATRLADALRTELRGN
ncbi:MAG: hypothetical protein H0V16_02495 [Burkholderiaceae bacterium]|nr:hypothetical protein [Burkholderiaceae bacterium]